MTTEGHTISRANLDFLTYWNNRVKKKQRKPKLYTLSLLQYSTRIACSCRPDSSGIVDVGFPLRKNQHDHVILRGVGKSSSFLRRRL